MRLLRKNLSSQQQSATIFSAAFRRYPLLGLVATVLPQFLPSPPPRKEISPSFLVRLTEWRSELSPSSYYLENRDEAARRILKCLQKQDDYLDLSELNLTSLPEGLFREFSQQSRINLSHNNLHHLPPDTFQGLRELSVLDLSRNGIQELHRDLFSGLELHQLDLSGNRLTDISEGSLSQLSALRSLDLSRNFNLRDTALSEVNRLRSSPTPCRVVLDNTPFDQSTRNSISIDFAEIDRIPEAVRFESDYPLRGVVACWLKTPETDLDIKYPVIRALERTREGEHIKRFLNRLYQNCEEQKPFPELLRTRVCNVLLLMNNEFESNQRRLSSNPESLTQRVIALANLGSGSCIDKLRAACVLFELEAQKHEPQNEKTELLQRILTATRLVNQTIDLVGEIAARRIIYDTRNSAFISFRDAISQYNRQRPDALLTIEDWETGSEDHNAILFISLQELGYYPIQVRDEVEDALFLIKSLPELDCVTISPITIRFDHCRSFTKDTYQTTAALKLIREQISEPVS